MLRGDLTESPGGVSYAHLYAKNGERIIVEERGDDRVCAGDRVGLRVDPARMFLFDAASETRIRTG